MNDWNKMKKMINQHALLEKNDSNNMTSIGWIWRPAWNWILLTPRTSEVQRVQKLLANPAEGLNNKKFIKRCNPLNHWYRREPVRASLKVPKRENFSLAFFALSEPIWVCDLGIGPNRPKPKVGGGCLGAHMCAYNVLFENLKFLGLLWMFKNSKKHKFNFYRIPVLNRCGIFFTHTQ